MKLQTVIIVILATIFSSCMPVLQHSLIPSPPPIDIFTPAFASTSTPNTTSGPSLTSTTMATAHPVLETGLPPSSTITPNATQAAQQEDIKNAIQAYFALRYQLFSVSPPENIHQAGHQLVQSLHLAQQPAHFDFGENGWQALARLARNA